MAIVARTNYASVAVDGLDALWASGGRQTAGAGYIGKVVLDGVHCQKHIVHDGDVSMGGERCEVYSSAIGVNEGGGYVQFGCKFMLAADFMTSSNGWNTLFQFHAPNDGPEQTNWAVHVINGNELWVRILGGAIVSGRPSIRNDGTIATVTKGVWHTLLVDINFHTTNGSCRMWLDGVLASPVAWQNIPTVHPSLAQGGLHNSQYVKQGMYRAEVDTGTNTIWYQDMIGWNNTGATSANEMFAFFGANPVPAPTVSSFLPTAGLVGTSVVITGTNLTGASAVTFNGVSCVSFTVNSATQITATVPAAATTGAVAVTTAGGTGTSSGSYTVGAAPASAFATGPGSPYLYGIYEVVLTGNGGVANPYDTLCTVTFTPPSGAGNNKAVQAFWDGSNTWRARCYTNEPGPWSWASSSSDAGLGAKNGTFSCISGGGLPGKIVKHATNPKYWARASGATFLPIGDTAWRLLSQQTEPSFRGVALANITETMYHDYVTDIVALNVNMIFTQMFNGSTNDSTWHDVWSDTPTCNTLNLAVHQFQDARIQWLHSNQPSLALNVMLMPDGPNGYGIDPTLWVGLTQAKRTRFLRYILARYAAYPQIVWSFTNDAIFDASHPNFRAMVDELGTYFLANDPWQALRSAGQTRNTGYYYASASWNDFMHLMCYWELPADSMASYTSNPRPVRNYEDYYEGTDRGITAPQYYYRWLFWSWILSGGSASYGNQLYDRLTPIEQTTYVGLDSVRYIGPYLAAKQIDMANYTPNDSLALDIDGATGTRRTQAANRGTTSYLVYHPNSATAGIITNGYALTLKATPAKIRLNLSAAGTGTYDVEWFRATDGLTVAGAAITGGGFRDLTAPWSGVDVVLRVTSTVTPPPPPPDPVPSTRRRRRPDQMLDGVPVPSIRAGRT